MKTYKKKKSAAPIYTFGLVWVLLSLITKMFRLGTLIFAALAAGLSSYLVGRKKKKQAEAEEAAERAAEEKAAAEAPPPVSYTPEVDAVLEERNRALKEMGRLYGSIREPEIRQKINELMRVTDKITMDAVSDPSDVPQIKRFLNYYLPTTIKLLNTYDRMSAQGIEGENLNKSMKSIEEMLDASIDAFKKHLDSLFADQALDIETEIDVMNQMLAREGLIGGKDFTVEKPGAASKGAVQQMPQ